MHRFMLLLAVLLLPSVASAQPGEKPAPLSKDIVAAWEKAGAKLGTMRMYEPGRIEFGPGEPAVLPAFYFDELSHGLLDSLPEPAVPFGIDLEGPYRGYGAGTDRRIVNGHLKGLDRFKNLYALNVARPEVTVAGMEIVGQCKNLRYLATDSAAMTNTGLRDLAGLGELRRHSLSSSSDIGLKTVAGFKNLRELSMRGSQFTDEGLKELVGLTKLQILDLTHAKVTDEGMKTIAQLPELRELDLTWTKIGDAGVARLSGLTKLKKLSLWETKVTDAGVEALAALRDLEVLDIRRNDISDAGLRAVGKLAKLRVLHLNRTKITDAGLKHLADLRQLQELHLEETQLSGRGLGDLAGLKELRWINLYHALNVDDAGAVELAKLSGLERLDVRRCKLTDAGLGHLARLKNLRSLKTSNTRVTADGIKVLAGRNLEEFDIPDEAQTDLGFKHYLAAVRPPPDGEFHFFWHTPRYLTNASLVELGQLGRIKTLRFNSDRITDDGLRVLGTLKNMQSLEHLDLRYIRLTDAGLPELQKLKGLKRLQLDEAKVTAEGLKGLAGMNLEYLTVPRHCWTDMGLKNYLAASPRPTELILSSTKITDAGLQPLTGVNSLRFLFLGGTGIGDEGLKAAAECTELIKLSVAYTKATDAGMKQLNGLPNLEWLSISGTTITVASLKELKSPEKLTTLYLNDMNVSDQDLKVLARFKNLKELLLSRTKVTDAGMKELLALKSLRTLYQNESPGITDAGMQVFARMPQLLDLKLDKTGVTNMGKRQLERELPDIAY